MPVIVSCPDCRRPLRVPDELLGRTVRCPQCKVLFMASVTGAAPAGHRGGADAGGPYPADFTRGPRDGYGRPQPPVRRPGRVGDEYDLEGDELTRWEIRRAWRRVRIGLTLTVIGGWFWVAGYGLLMFSMVLGTILGASAVSFQLRGRAEAAAGTAGGLLVVVGLCAAVYALCSVVELVLRAVGCGLCMAVPDRRGTAAKTLAITSFALGCASAVMALAGVALALHRGSEWVSAPAAWRQPAAHIPQLVALVLGLAGFTVFLTFGRSAAKELRDHDLAAAFRRLLVAFGVWYSVVIFGSLALLLTPAAARFLSAAGLPGPRSGLTQETLFTVAGMVALMVLFVAIILVIGLEALVIWYVRVLARLRRATYYGDM
jgi:hypothetical protein